MMDIDIERLKTDAEYWDEVAPAGATHCNTNVTVHSSRWWRKVEDRMYELRDDKWNERLFWPERSIPRPTKPAAPEWNGEGLPPVGCECEIANPMSNEFDLVEVLAHKGEWVIYWSGDTAGKAGSDWFRPIRTKEQRQRDELADLIERNMMAKGSFWTPEECADVVVDFYKSRYNLEPKDA